MTHQNQNYFGAIDKPEASAGSVRWPLVAYKHLCSHRKIKQKDTCCCLAVNLDRTWEAILEGALVAKTREEAALEGWVSLSCSSQRLSSKKLEPTEGWDTLRAGAPCGGDLFALQVLDACNICCIRSINWNVEVTLPGVLVEMYSCTNCSSVAYSVADHFYIL